MTGKRSGRSVGLGGAIVEQVECARLVDYPRAWAKGQVRQAPVGAPAWRWSRHRAHDPVRIRSTRRDRGPRRAKPHDREPRRLERTLRRSRDGRGARSCRLRFAAASCASVTSSRRFPCTGRNRRPAAPQAASSKAVTSDEAADSHVGSATVERPRSGADARRLYEQATGVLHGSGSPQFIRVHGSAGHGIDGNEQHEQPPNPRRASENTADADNRAADRHGVDSRDRRKRRPCGAGNAHSRHRFFSGLRPW